MENLIYGLKFCGLDFEATDGINLLLDNSFDPDEWEQDDKILNLYALKQCADVMELDIGWVEDTGLEVLCEIVIGLKTDGTLDDLKELHEKLVNKLTHNTIEHMVALLMSVPLERKFRVYNVDGTEVI